MSMAISQKAEIVKPSARSAHDAGSPKFKSRCSPHASRTDPALQDASERPPRPAQLAQDGEPAPQLLDYLKNNDAERYSALIHKLGLRK